MSETNFTPYLEFVSNQILKASDLNIMQKRIAEAIYKTSQSGSGSAGSLLKTIEYDFVTDGIPTVSFDIEIMGMKHMSFYKISDTLPKKEQLNGSIFYSNYHGDREAYEPFILSEDMIMFETDTMIGYGSYHSNAGNYAIGFAYEAGLVKTILEGYEIEINVPEAGIYLLYDGSISDLEWYTSLTYFDGVQSNWEENNPLSESYIINRPVYECRKKYEPEIILSETTVSNFEPVTVADNIIYRALLPAPENLMSITRNYTVSFNGNSHLLSCLPTLSYKVEDNSYNAFSEAFSDASYVLGNQSLGGVDQNNLINGNLNYAIVGGTNGTAIQLYLFSRTNEPVTLSIIGSDIIIPKNSYYFADSAASGYPWPLLIPTYWDMPIASLEKEGYDYLVTFEGKEYLCSMTTDGPRMLGLAAFVGLGEPDKLLSNESKLPFAAVDYISMTKEATYYKIMGSPDDAEELGNLAEFYINSASYKLIYEDAGSSLPTMVLAKTPGTHEIEIRKIPKEIKELNPKLLPNLGRNWDSAPTDTKYIKKLPFGKNHVHFGGNIFCTGTATLTGTMSSLYFYTVALDSDIIPSELKDRYYFSFNNGQYGYELGLYGSDIPFMGNLNIMLHASGIPVNQQDLNTPPILFNMLSTSTLLMITTKNFGDTIAIEASEMEKIITPIPQELMPKTSEGETLILPKFNSSDEGKVLKIINGVPTWTVL